MRGLSQVTHLPFFRFHQLGLPCQRERDAVSVLTEHVLAHVISPRTLLTNIFGVLKPGGYLFLDEKDMLRPARYQTRSGFDSGPAYQYQLTLHTTASYLQSVGFELVDLNACCQAFAQGVRDGQTEAIVSLVRHNASHPNKIQKIEQGCMESYLGTKAISGKEYTRFACLFGQQLRCRLSHNVPAGRGAWRL